MAQNPKPKDTKMLHHPSKLFVGGLNVKTDDQSLRQYFGRFGDLTDYAVVPNKSRGRSRCFGFVTYAKPEQADAAMAARPHTVDGNAVDVKRAVPLGTKEPAFMERKVFVGGLNNDIFEYQLTQYFSQYGEVEKSEIIVDSNTRMPRGFAYVQFKDASATDKAALVKFHTVNGHKVEVKKAVTEQKIQEEDKNYEDYASCGSSHTVDGNDVEVKQAVEKAQRDLSEPPSTAMKKKIFVGGLKNDILEFHLNQYFSQYGEVEKSEIMTDMVTGRNRGFGFVHFTDPSAADKAALVKFHTVNGHKVEVKKALTKQEIQGEDVKSSGVVGVNQNAQNGRDYPRDNTSGGCNGSHGAEYSHQKSSNSGSQTVDVNTVEVKRAVEKIQCTKPQPVANAIGKKIFVGGLKNDISEFHLTQYFSQYGEVEKSEIMTDLVTGRNRGFGFVHFTDPSATDSAVLVKFHTVNGHRVEVKKALTKQEIQGEDGTTPRVSGQNQNENGSSHGAGYSDQGSYGNGAGFYGNQGYGISNTAGYSGQGSYYPPPYSYGSGATFNNHAGYSGTYTCGGCGYQNILGGGNVYNGYGQFYSGYNPNSYHFTGQGTAPYTSRW